MSWLYLKWISSSVLSLFQCVFFCHYFLLLTLLNKRCLCCEIVDKSRFKSAPLSNDESFVSTKTRMILVAVHKESNKIKKYKIPLLLFAEQFEWGDQVITLLQICSHHLTGKWRIKGSAGQWCWPLRCKCSVVRSVCLSSSRDSVAENNTNSRLVYWWFRICVIAISLRQSIDSCAAAGRCSCPLCLFGVCLFSTLTECGLTLALPIKYMYFLVQFFFLVRLQATKPDEVAKERIGRQMDRW